MKAVRMTQPGGPDGLRIEEVADPQHGPEEALVHIRATALNRADLLQTKGLYPAPPGAVQDIPGLEFAGEIAAVGSRCQRWKVGDRVMGLTAGGAWAEKICAHERELIAAPLNDLSQAAAIPEAFITAWDALVRQAHLSVGQTVLIHAAASGVGTAAIQLCKLYGATSIGTARNAEKLQRVASLGLTHSLVTDTKPLQFAAQVKALVPQGVDVVLDLVGGPYVSESLAALALKGTIMLVGLVGGVSHEIPLNVLLGKRARLIGTTLRARPLEEKISVAREFETAVAPLFKTGALKPVIDAVVPMTQITAALHRMANNETVGKTVLTW